MPNQPLQYESPQASGWTKHEVAVLEVIPSIDLRQGQVVRLQQGDYARQLNYPVDPIETARSYKQAGARWLHIVDLDGAKEGRPVQTELISKIITDSGLRVQTGGGIREREHITRLLNAGAERIVLGTKAIQDWDWFSQLVQEPAFAHKLVLALDAKQGRIATHGWTETTGRMAVDVAREVSDWPLAAILYTDVAKDGMLQGQNLEQTRALAEAGRVPVIASGGVGNLSHILQLRELPVWGVIVGRSLYEGTLDLKSAIVSASR